MKEKYIILATVVMLLASFVFLSFYEQKQSDINTKNIWVIYFTDPKSTSLDFAIENHSDKSNFHWKVLEGKNVLNEGDTVTANGKTSSIPVATPQAQGKKLIISVTSGNDTKEIYKIL